MCGLAGMARLGGGALRPDAEDLLGRMTRAVAHRGPDESVVTASGPVGFGFVRLSLVDPLGGGQPFRTDDGDLLLMVNGEIYNHAELEARFGPELRLRTGSDCEVLLHLYRRHGLSFLDRVEGMFSFVLWDRARGRLIFARDRFGIKPLFFHQDGERVVFASEIKALFEDARTPRELDWARALGDQALNGATVSAHREPVHAWFRDIHLVPAATIVTIDLANGERREQRYWDFPDYTGDAAGSESELVCAYGETLAASVADCEMGDVEIGLFLSGGIDSASIAALAGSKPRTFTALNASTLGNQDAEYGHRIARHLGLDNHQVLFEADRVPTVQEWRDHLWLLETPLAGPESYYKYEMYRYVAQHAPEIKGMMLGAGSDEFNGGYSTSLAGGGSWEDFLAGVAALDVKRELGRRPELATWWELAGPPLLRPESVLGDGAPDRAQAAYSALFRWKYRDVQIYNCWHEDHTAGGNGIEARVPFLDHRLVEIAAAVPPALRSSLIWDKQLLRRAMADVLPEEYVQRPKIPFFYGDGVRYTYRAFARMLLQDDGALVRQAFESPRARQFLDRAAIDASLRAVGEDPDGGPVEHLLAVVNLGLLDTMLAQLPAVPLDAARRDVARCVEVTDWDVQQAEIEDRVMRRPEPEPGWVLALADDRLLLRDVHDPARSYLTVQGTIEYELDDEMPGWLRFLGELDGLRTVSEALGAADVELSEIAELLAISLDEGILVRAGLGGQEP